MINTKEYSEAAVEVLDILTHLDEDIIALIPMDFIMKLKNNRSKTYIANIDYTKPLEDNNLKHYTKVILTLIYRDYICLEDEKNEINKILKDKELKKYNNNMFNSNNDQSNQSEDNMMLIKTSINENIFKRIINKLFKIR